MFRRISYTIALQFTAFIFLLLVINGAIFLAADFGNAYRQRSSRLQRTAAAVVASTQITAGGIRVDLPPMMREQVRIADPLGNTIFAGELFEDIPFSERGGLSLFHREHESYAILTAPIVRNGQIVGYMQIAEVERQPLGDLPERALLYLLVSAGISLLTFFVGLLFARTSLRPAEEMVRRLEQFTQDASHELRTPLATLNSSLELALKTGKHREGLESARADIKEITSLIERLLELARLDRFVLQTESIDLSELLADAAERHRGIARQSHVTITEKIEPGVTVRGDPALIRQIFLNLLSNAIKFAKPGGGEVVIHLTKEKLMIKDEGIGIAKESLSHIFDRFYQADTSRTNDGYGLGLSLVKRIVDLHGWTIAAESHEGKMTVFTVRFRRSNEPKSTLIVS